MTSEEYADLVTIYVKEAQSRILGTGKEQYSVNGHQAFESMTPTELLYEARDELLDELNYVVASLSRIDSIINTLEDYNGNAPRRYP